MQLNKSDKNFDKKMYNIQKQVKNPLSNRY